MLVAQPVKLLVEEFGGKGFHISIVSYKRQGVKLEGEEGASQIWGGCCLKQDLGIFRIAGERLMAGWRILFAVGEWADVV